MRCDIEQDFYGFSAIVEETADGRRDSPTSSQFTIERTSSSYEEVTQPLLFDERTEVVAPPEGAFH